MSACFPSKGFPSKGFPSIKFYTLPFCVPPFCVSQGLLSSFNGKSRREAERFFGRRVLDYGLKSILGGGAVNVCLRHDSHGAPLLMEKRGEILTPSPFVVSMSYSHGYVIVALALGAQIIGVDVEVINPNRDIKELSGFIFKQEITSPEKFYGLWCLYEAFVKMEKTGVLGSNGFRSYQEASLRVQGQNTQGQNTQGQNTRSERAWFDGPISNVYGRSFSLWEGVSSGLFIKTSLEKACRIWVFGLNIEGDTFKY